MLAYLLLIFGLALLFIGGDLLVRGSVGLAEKLRIPGLLIGLTIVAFGTSAPELFISVKAALEGSSGIAVGNVVGSNIANVLLVMGLPALLRPSSCDDEGIGRNILIMIGFTIVFMVMMAGGRISRFEGLILLGLIVLFLWAQFDSARHASKKALKELDYHDEVHDIPSTYRNIVVLIVCGIVALPIGADLTVDSAIEIARRWNVSEAAIGLTIVALGTSLPELATAMMAVLRGNSSIAIGNVVGSNIFNIASIMGLVAIIRPLDVGSHILRYDMWVMFACALLISVLAHWKVKIGKRVGLALTGAYVVYVVTAFA